MGRSSKYKVRFASSATPYPALPRKPRGRIPQIDEQPAQTSRSRLACHGCRIRHIKCDERFPVCTQCRAKGLVCMPRGRPTQWRIETPWLRSRSLLAMPALNPRLLQYWLENASHMMTLDLDNNPMSFPIVGQLLESESLVHVLQSVSAAYEVFYDPPSIHESLVERSKALQTLGQELRAQTTIRPQTFLAVYMLGVSSPWIDYSPSAFGQEHLLAARSILDELLRQQDFVDHPYRSFIIAAFIWWDMSCSLLVSPDEQKPLDTPEIDAAVTSLQGRFCAILSHAIELVYELGRLGRYCRMVCDLQIRDLALEDAFESRLLAWEHSSQVEPLRTLNETFRLHGLVMLYRLCNRTSPVAETEDYIRECILSMLQNISQIRTHSPVFKFIHIPLLNAAAELTAEDESLRKQVLDWCAVLYSTNRSPINTWTVELLQSHWGLKDAGDRSSWLHLMLQKGWRLNLG
ncbi:fungal-specific transcription factor domain-containing protein [Talaromyces proteolyticus]|uniref:Fungal-specific transcription factor domain-containing protein n=1 Tax=Talaromyces proteolyticus TaxID=1131652 RepID=A0AAD4KHL9_9EURO|nr:fungal-specific transcription factor domain-containing protein [Talaromyces proteolyticus]KAH8688661.1 fungal-specific transcription factor domain-containing protein [Talaromyces proteolyticus]